MGTVLKTAVTTLSKYEEQLFLGFLLIIAVVMFVRAEQFPDSARTFPQLVAVPVIVGVLIIFIVNIIPYSSERIEQLNIQFGATEEGETDDVSERSQLSGLTVSGTNSLITILWIICFLVAGYLFGLLWVTPIFVFVYVYAFKRNLPIAILLSILGFGIGFGFYWILNVSIDEGTWITIYEGTIPVVSSLLTGPTTTL